jgi:pSer/pThr/pTyr-binding forkhead associated (FHA) protein
VLTFDTGQQETVPLPRRSISAATPRLSSPATSSCVRGKDLSLSRTHARLEHRESGVWVTDNGSTNGTDLLDEAGRATPLAAGVRTEVEDGSRVRIGDRVFTISRLVGGMS